MWPMRRLLPCCVVVDDAVVARLLHHRARDVAARYVDTGMHRDNTRVEWLYCDGDVVARLLRVLPSRAAEVLRVRLRDEDNTRGNHTKEEEEEDRFRTDGTEGTCDG